MDKENLPTAGNGPLANTDDDRKHVFPCNYFYLDGGIPADKLEEVQELKSRWHFQIGTPKNDVGENDYAHFEAQLVIGQMERMKTSLKEFAKERYWMRAKTEARCVGMENLSQKIVTNQDLCDCLNNLQRSQANEQNVYLTLYGWFRNHYWFEQETVDLWAAKMNYRILLGKRTGNKRAKDPLLGRHGFGQIVKDARSDTIKTITRSMQRESGWKVVATNKSSQSDKNELYEEQKCMTKTGKFYIVTPLEKQVRTENNWKHTKT
jgi:hypothetical protein